MVLRGGHEAARCNVQQPRCRRGCHVAQIIQPSVGLQGPLEAGGCAVRTCGCIQYLSIQLYDSGSILPDMLLAWPSFASLTVHAATQRWAAQQLVDRPAKSTKHAQPHSADILPHFVTACVPCKHQWIPGTPGYMHGRHLTPDPQPHPPCASHCITRGVLTGKLAGSPASSRCMLATRAESFTMLSVTEARAGGRAAMIGSHTACATSV